MDSKRCRYAASNGQLTKTLYSYDAETIYLRDNAERLWSRFCSTNRPVSASRETVTAFAADATALRFTLAARFVVRIGRSLAVMTSW